MKGGSVEMKSRLLAAEAVPPLPPPPPLPQWTRTRKAVTKSVTREEIKMFWRRRRMKEEEHLLAAEKAAARIKARTMTEEDYVRFEDALKDDLFKDDKNSEDMKEGNCSHNNSNIKELRVGIKDWWTKSKYAYLNQPAIRSMDGTCKYKSTYIPNSCSFHQEVISLPASTFLFSR